MVLGGSQYVKILHLARTIFFSFEAKRAIILKEIPYSKRSNRLSPISLNPENVGKSEFVEGFKKLKVAFLLEPVSAGNNWRRLELTVRT